MFLDNGRCDKLGEQEIQMQERGVLRETAPDLYSIRCVE